MIENVQSLVNNSISVAAFDSALKESGFIEVFTVHAMGKMSKTSYYLVQKDRMDVDPETEIEDFVRNGNTIQDSVELVNATSYVFIGEEAVEFECVKSLEEMGVVYDPDFAYNLSFSTFEEAEAYRNVMSENDISSDFYKD